jgi:hypothetical protein
MSYRTIRSAIASYPRPCLGRTGTRHSTRNTRSWAGSTPHRVRRIRQTGRTVPEPLGLGLGLRLVLRGVFSLLNGTPVQRHHRDDTGFRL